MYSALTSFCSCAMSKVHSAVDYFVTFVTGSDKHQFVHESLIRYMPHTGALLDLGSGDGCVGFSIKEARPRLDVWPIDISDSWIWGDRPCIFNGVDIPKASSCANVILLCFVLHHTEHVDDLLADALRVLCAGGKILVVEDIVETVWDRLFTSIHGWASCTRGEFHSEDEWTAILEDATGLTVTPERIPSGPRWSYPVHRCIFKIER